MMRALCMLISLAIFSSLSSITFAMDDKNVIIVNHYPEDLLFKIGINPSVLPDLPTKFLLNKMEQVQSRVIDMQKSAYVRIEKDKDHHAFWAVNIINNKLTFHGYISKGIAFSWKDQTITFCTPDEYKQKGSCERSF